MRKAHICGGSLIAIAASTLLGQSAFAQTAAPPPKDKVADAKPTS